ncbi:hypothetical protein WAE56_18365 [Iodobacter sp. LRB]|uniref:hypothetical protein n=1 Tax=unclassified Iodobacter TaxID=235634 RepID=UPI000C11B973|nr:hypothetical protein [Iodobacter sp. BJB302]PHV01627.1 hypothetical protein CSQ88_10835 [Iodobacter sp. BJB302]
MFYPVLRVLDKVRRLSKRKQTVTDAVKNERKKSAAYAALFINQAPRTRRQSYSVVVLTWFMGLNSVKYGYDFSCLS